MIKIICVGKLKEKYLTELVNDYKKRISKYHKIEIIEIKDNGILKEREQILSHLNEKDYIITLDINGLKISTMEFKEKIENLFNNGISNIIFVIGGTDGLDKQIIDFSNYNISFSLMTFPHGLFRGILLEQIYRVFKIINNETYHK